MYKITSLTSILILLHIVSTTPKTNIFVNDDYSCMTDSAASNRPYYNTPMQTRGENLSPSKNITLEEIIKIKTLSSDSSEGHILIVWNEEILQKFLDEDYDLVLTNTRAVYAIFFIFSIEGDCPSVKEKLSNVLMRLWKQYNVLNVLAQTPCSCAVDTVYTYQPFHRTDDNSWGLVRDFTIDEVASNFGVTVNSFWDVNGYPVPISMFSRRPTALDKLPKSVEILPIYQNLSVSKGFGGLDGCLLGELARYLNFDVKIVELLDKIDFGAVLPNGTVTGSLGDVVKRRAQFSGNGRFLMDYGTEEIEFTIPYSSDDICAVVPKAKRIPQWRMFLKCVKIQTWLAIFIVMVISTLFWYLFKKHNPNWWEIFSIFVGIPLKISPTISEALFLGACMIFNVIIIGILQGSLFTDFSTVTYYKDINTLEELDESGLPVSTSLSVLDSDDSELIRSLRTKKVILDDAVSSITMGAKIATLQRKNDVSVFLLIDYVKNDGVSSLYVVPECLTSYFIAYIVPKGSPFLNIFNYVIAKFIESGLTSKWYSDIVESVILEMLVTFFNTQKLEIPFSLKDLKTAFYLLILGNFLATVVLIFEMLSFKKLKLYSG
ncbi:Lig chan domain containing protein, partial [Asbolus verrucosus]